MKKRVALLMTIALIAAGLVVWRIFFTEKKGDVAFKTVTATNDTVRTTVTATGTIEPIDVVEVGTQVSGRIKSITVDFNSRVKKGMLLAELDRTTLLANVTQAEAALKSVQIEYAYEKKNYERTEKLYNQKLISDEDLESVLYSFEKSEAAVERSAAELEKAKNNLYYTRIYSPIDGIVLNRAVEEGQTVAASLNAPVLFTIAKDLKKMEVKAAIDEADIGQVMAGQKATFTVDAFPDSIFGAAVTEIRLQPQVVSNVVTYTVILETENRGMVLMPGMTATIAITTREAVDVLTIPTTALRFKPDSEMMQRYFNMKRQERGAGTPEGAKQRSRERGPGLNGEPGRERDGNSAAIWIKSDDFIRRQKIKTGINDGSSVQILEGIREGDEVVTGLVEKSDGKEKDKEPRSTNNPLIPQRPGRRR